MSPTQLRIIAALTERPSMSFRDLAFEVDRSVATTYTAVQKLKRLGLLRYDTCPTCGGGMLLPVKGDSDGRRLELRTHDGT